MTDPVIISRIHPEQNDCATCGTEVEFDHFTVQTADGPVCQMCANDAAAGLGDVAHGLSLIKWALAYDVAPERYTQVAQLTGSVAKLSRDVASGAVYFAPAGSGAGDSETAARRLAMRVVPGGE